MLTKRKWLVVAALLGWVAVVIVGSGRRTPDTALLGVDHVGLVLYGVLVLLALSGLVLIVVLNPFRGGWNEPDKKGRRPTWLLLVIVLVLLVWQPQLLDNFVQEEEPTAQTGAVGASRGTSGSDSEPPAETVAQATDLMLLAAGIAVIGAVWYFAGGRAGGEPEAIRNDGEVFEADLATAIEEAGAELAAAVDPREAVLRAYAILESSLASHGFRRMTSETSTEHVRRALRNLRVDPTPVAQLGALYEVARFSDLPITHDDQRQAAHALEMARAELMVNT